MEGTFGPSSFGCGACHHQAPKLGLSGMRIDGCVALLTSDQTIDRPSKEPLLGLDSFTFSGSRMVSSNILGRHEVPWRPGRDFPISPAPPTAPSQQPGRIFANSSARFLKSPDTPALTLETDKGPSHKELPVQKTGQQFTHPQSSAAPPLRTSGREFLQSRLRFSTPLELPNLLGKQLQPPPSFDTVGRSNLASPRSPNLTSPGRIFESPGTPKPSCPVSPVPS
ncbi:unnamed protein product [Prunus armeniaca]